LNLTSAIGDLANRNILTSYVSHLNAMAYDIREEDGGAQMLGKGGGEMDKMQG
jgi:hypothetical protein